MQIHLPWYDYLFAVFVLLGLTGFAVCVALVQLADHRIREGEDID